MDSNLSTEEILKPPLCFCREHWCAYFVYLKIACIQLIIKVLMALLKIV